MHTSYLIKPASSLCNLRCRYCFYADVSANRDIPSFGIMNRETSEKIIENAFCGLKDGDSVSFLFQGGEPTLAGLPFFEYFVDFASRWAAGRFQVDYSIQTNGTLLDEAWCRFLAEHQFLVGLSLDGDAQTHNQNRVDASGVGTWNTVMNAKRLMDQQKVEYNVLWVLTEETARHPERFWKFLVSQDIRYVQFIPCLEGLDQNSRPAWALTPQRFSSFYTGLFALWSRDFFQGKYRSVKFFDDILNLLVRRQVTACGFTGQCQIQSVIEADGSVYPCDFYVLDQWRMGNLAQQALTELYNASQCNAFLIRERPEGELCKMCPYWNMCGGGCPRMHACLCDDKAGFCGYRDFLDRCGPGIERVASALAIAE